MRRRNMTLAIILLVVAVGFFIYNQSDYYLSAKRAIQHTTSYSSQAQVFEKSLGSDEVVILSDGSRSKVQIVYRKWGFLYKLGTSVEMAALQGNAHVQYAWFSSNANTHDGKRELVFAAQSSDAAIKTVIISNDKLSAPQDSAEVKKNASVYIALDVANKYGITMEALDVNTIGSFVVRAADADGRIVAGN